MTRNQADQLVWKLEAVRSPCGGKKRVPKVSLTAAVHSFPSRPRGYTVQPYIQTSSGGRHPEDPIRPQGRAEERKSP